MRITLETLRAALAAQPATVDGHLKCGHHQSLAINSAETGEFLYCDLCDAKSRCRDAEAMEAELRAALAAQPAEAQQEPVAWQEEALGGWKEATIGWSVCASVHLEWAKGKDGVFKTRQADFVRHENDARSKYTALSAAQPAPAAVPLTDEQIKDALLQYRCAHFQDEDGGLPLTDALAHAFGDTDITRAKHEIEMIVDAIAAAAAGDKP